MKIPIISIMVLFFISSYAFSQENAFAEINLKTQHSENISINQTELNFGFRIMKDKNSELKSKFGYTNSSISYSDTEYGNDDYLDQFNSLSYTLEYEYAFSEKNSFTIIANPVANFETKIHASDIYIFGGVEFTNKLAENTKVSIGIQRNTIFGKPQILPTFNFNYRFKNKVELDLGFPNANISYSNNERNTFSITNDFNGYFYNTNEKIIIQNTEIEKVSWSQMTTGLQYKRKFNENFILEFKGGYDFNKKFRLNNSSDNTKYYFDINDGYTFKLGIKYQL